MKEVPYIGITDFTNAAQAAAMRRVLDEEKCNHLLHVGVMMSYKTLHGQPTKWAGIFPPKESLKEIFVRAPGILNVLHYADYDDKSSTNDFVEALRWAGPNVDAIQFDMPWPDVHDVSDFRAHYRDCGNDIKIILQVGAKAIDYAGNPGSVAQRIYAYRDCADIEWVLFDLSGGKGVPMNASQLLDFVWTTLYHNPELNIAVAGGLGPDTIDLAELIVKDLAREGIPVSLDAQSKLRSSGNAMDPIEWPRATEYLHRAAALLEKYGSVAV